MGRGDAGPLLPGHGEPHPGLRPGARQVPPGAQVDSPHISFYFFQTNLGLWIDPKVIVLRHEILIKWLLSGTFERKSIPILKPKLKKSHASVPLKWMYERRMWCPVVLSKFVSTSEIFVPDAASTFLNPIVTNVNFQNLEQLSQHGRIVRPPSKVVISTFEKDGRTVCPPCLEI